MSLVRWPDLASSAGSEQKEALQFLFMSFILRSAAGLFSPFVPRAPAGCFGRTLTPRVCFAEHGGGAVRAGVWRPALRRPHPSRAEAARPGGSFPHPLLHDGR